MRNIIFNFLTTAKKAWVCRRLALADYQIESGELMIKSPDGMITVTFMDADVVRCIHDYANYLEDIYEPLSEYLKQHGTGNLIMDLLNYKDTSYAYTLGKDIPGEYLCKLYHEYEPQEIEQNGFGRTWIDFSGQIREHPAYIMDESSMWASTLSLAAMLQSTVLERYGNSIFILRPFAMEKYIVLPKEIVGKRYEVLLSGDLYDSRTWQQLEKMLPVEDYKKAWEMFCTLKLE